MKSAFMIFLFIFLSLSCFSQSADPIKIVERNSCCDNLEFRLPFGDTATYNEVISLNGLWVADKHCMSKFKAPILSFEISINNQKKQVVKGNHFDFEKLVQLKTGGQISITNCIANCESASGKKTGVILPERIIFVKPK